MSDSTTPPLWLQVPETHDLVRRFGSGVDVPAFGGRLEVDWSPGERVTSVGGLVFFATFLKETGLFDRLCEDFPNSCTSNTRELATLSSPKQWTSVTVVKYREAITSRPAYIGIMGRSFYIGSPVSGLHNILCEQSQ